MPEDLNKEVVVHEKCGKIHIDKDKWAKFNHTRHLCEYCHEFFYVKIANIGIEK